MKKQTMKARGIRFTDDQWNNITKEAKQRKPKETPSDLLREIIDQRYNKRER